MAWNGNGPRRLILAQKKASLMLDSDYLMIRRRDEKLPDEVKEENGFTFPSLGLTGFSSLAWRFYLSSPLPVGRASGSPPFPSSPAGVITWTLSKKKV